MTIGCDNLEIGKLSLEQVFNVFNVFYAGGEALKNFSREYPRIDPLPWAKLFEEQLQGMPGSALGQVENLMPA